MTPNGPKTAKGRQLKMAGTVDTRQMMVNRRSGHTVKPVASLVVRAVVRPEPAKAIAVIASSQTRANPMKTTAVK
ncbi:hypothetical protein MPUL_14120 [Mycolicibacterium pulveris]|uniref:Uncharacterized protein n=1 Tax=Mycolicibacterium pulveris TaxID=36813 RepID=A0A7I7UFL7_MYCPV|nr:hypothetical protein MPUL_14120 [Mycolicibacterium pulveris]